MRWYDVKTNQWLFIAHMNHQRSDASAAAMAAKVYIVGGFNVLFAVSLLSLVLIVSNVWTHRQ